MQRPVTELEVALAFPVDIDATLTVNFNVEHFKVLFEYLLGVLRNHAANLTYVQQTLLNSVRLDNHGTLCEEKLHLHQAVQATAQGYSYSIEPVERVRRKTVKPEKSRELEEKLSETNEHTTQETLSESAIKRVYWKLEDFECRLSEIEHRVSEGLKDTAPVEDPPAETQLENNSELENSKEDNNSPALELNEDTPKDLHRVLLECSQDSERAYRLASSALAKASEHLHQIQSIRLELNEHSKSLERLQRTKADSEDLPREVTQHPTQGLELPQGALDSLQNQMNYLAQALELKAQKSAVDSLDHSKADKTAVLALQTLKADRSALDRLEDLLSSHATALQRLKELVQQPTTQAAPPQQDHRSRLPTDTSHRELQQKLSAINKRALYTEQQLKLLCLPEGTTLTSMLNDIEAIHSNYTEINEKLAELRHSLRSSIKDKAESSALTDLKSTLEFKLLELSKTMKQQYADRAKTKQALKRLESLNREALKPQERNEAEDALLARKPLGGWSCASCAQKLETFIGKVGPYHSWNKLPYKVYRANPGFSRALAVLPLEQLMTARTVGVQDPKESFSLPPVARQSNE